MNEAGLALRNLLRNRRRSLTTMAAMVVGAVTVLLFGGYSRDIVYGLETQTVDNLGHLQVQHRDYFLYGTGNPGAYGIAHYRRVMEVIARDPELAGQLRVMTPTLTLGGIAGNFAAGVSRTVVGTGSVVEDQARLRAWNDYGFPESEHRLSLRDTPDDAVVIGRGVARSLQLCAPLGVPDCPAPLAERAGASAAPEPDDLAALAASEAAPRAAPRGLRIELLAASARGAPNVASLQVVRAEQQGVKEFDDMYVGMHLGQAQRLVYGADEPRVTAIVIQLAHTAQIPQAQRRIEQLLRTTLSDQPLQVLDFRTLNPFFGQAVRMFASIFGFISVLIGVIVLFTASNTMGMAVVERTTEIGTLRAIGLRRGGIRRLFMWEGFLLGVAGSLLGVGIALGLAWLIAHGGLTWAPPGQSGRVPLSVRVWGEPDLIVGTAAMLVLASTLSAWWPARRAARLNIVEALRHV